MDLDENLHEFACKLVCHQIYYFFFRKLIFLLGQLIVLNSYLNASQITLWPDLTDFVQQIIEHLLLLLE